jgi:hypothetical protein
VPSSTSSSSAYSADRIPQGSWARTWIAALCLAVLIVAGLESWWRHDGYRASIVDDADLWSLFREQVYGRDGKKAVVLLGASRIQLDIATDEFRRLFPQYHLVQLAIDGRHPLASLKDLAEDERFDGIVICAVTPRSFPKAVRDHQQHYVEHYHERWNLDAKLNRLIASYLQQHLAILYPRTNLLHSLSVYIDHHGRPRPPYLITHPDRSRSADYTMIDVDAHRRHRIRRVRHFYENARIPDPDAWLAEASDVNVWVDRIQARGGRVAFVRFPTTGETYALDQHYYPKTQYWDRFAAITPAATLHFSDVPALARFQCPDTSHLDYRDTPAFTRALTQALVERGVLERPAEAATPVR